MFNLLNNLNDKTAVLESLDWNEEALEQLMSFISLQNECFIPTHPGKLLAEIEEHFGTSTREVMEKIMSREYDLIKRGEYNEN